ncbi:hypothetical protein OMW55_02840 [Sphingomonas sp. BN140010]|uniref:Uncharacterized protein n=1 Tax=Sphingomonas arvum TaxID=2992113 RepID=A0ABT3JCE6_9SPHN|nr:hypothetical protein [Sphingomonas sp. BN140010]MCW3796743.1 hypothetical protein [Sphingomonas sp. BN140010]
MRWTLLRLALASGLVVVPNVASATTIVVMTDPMSLERRTVVLDTPGPDRLFVCAAPPAVSGCRELPIKR